MFYVTPGGDSDSHQLLSDTLYQRVKAEVIILTVVVHVLHQLGDGLGVSFRLKFIPFALLKQAETTNKERIRGSFLTSKFYVRNEAFIYLV